MASFAYCNTPYAFSPELDADVRRLNNYTVKKLNGFTKTISNITLVNATLSQPVSVKINR